MTAFATGSIDASGDKLSGEAFDSLRQGGPSGFSLGWHDAYLDLDPDELMPSTASTYEDDDEDYQDGYTSRWFPIQDAPVTCGLRTDLPRKQRVHDYVSLGKDFKNKGIAGICEVIVFACSVCGRDWRE